MKRYNLGEQYDAHQMLYAMQESEGGQWVRYEAVAELEQEVQEQAQVIKAALEAIEVYAKREADAKAVINAARKLVKAKGRFQTEQNFMALEAAVKALEGK